MVDFQRVAISWSFQVNSGWPVSAQRREALGGAGLAKHG